MSNIAIRVEGIGKLYRLGARERYGTLRDTLVDTFVRPFRRRSSSPANDPADQFWALKDISFEVKEGEVIGIIGRNGAGKSTLLKILSRITEPTEGQASIHGRMASLLEVGTGFHPELTGRENIFLNGAILGMKRAEIRRKFDEIVAFAEVDRFIDTPVKRYSSGMYVRLAFAVAAHLEPEILVVDEVLAVGDHQFQTKCLNKMNEVGRTGRTVFFVSHSMSAIQRLCNRVLLLSGGRIQADTDVMGGIAEYLRVDVPGSYSRPSSPARPSITRADVEVVEDTIYLSVEFSSPFPLSPPVLGFVIYDPMGSPVFGTNSRGGRAGTTPEAADSGRIEVRIPAGCLRPNQYYVSLWLADAYHDYCALDKVLQFQLDIGESFDDLPPQLNGNLSLPTTWRFYSGSPALARGLESLRRD
jgi:lipopolysaccharide transport system ATP-binding protein